MQCLDLARIELGNTAVVVSVDMLTKMTHPAACRHEPVPHVAQYVISVKSVAKLFSLDICPPTRRERLFYVFPV